jgi:MFS family permease
MERLALGTLVYRISGYDEAWLALVAFAPALPVFAVSLPAGAAVDRLHLRRLVIGTQTAMAVAAVAMAAFVQWGSPEPWHIVAYSVVSATLFAADAPARQSFVPRIVPRSALTNALALNAVGFNTARLLGGIAFWAVVKHLGWGEAGCLAVNALTFLLPIVVLLRIREEPLAEAPPAGSPAESHGPTFTAGIRFALRQPVVRASLLFLAASGLFGFQISQLLPVYAEKVWFVGREVVGTLQAAMGIGALVGALLLAGRSHRTHRGRLVLRNSLAASAFLAAIAFVPDPDIALLLLAAAGFLLIQVHSACNALIQSHVPDALRGRVVALFTLTVLGCFPVGGLLCGLIAKSWGAPATTLLCAELLLAACLAIRATHRGLAHAE